MDQESVKKSVKGMWKLIMAKGVILAVVGMILLLFPTATLTTLIFIMGAYWFIDGIATCYNSYQSRKINSRWGWGMFMGALSLIAGLIVLVKPFSSTVLTTSFLIWFLGIIAIINGISGIVSGIRAQKQNTGKRSILFGGIFSLILGFILISSPFTSALVIVKIIGSFTLFAGVITILLAMRVKKKVESEN